MYPEAWNYNKHKCKTPKYMHREVIFRITVFQTSISGSKSKLQLLCKMYTL